MIYKMPIFNFQLYFDAHPECEDAIRKSLAIFYNVWYCMGISQNWQTAGSYSYSRVETGSQSCESIQDQPMSAQACFQNISATKHAC